MELIIQLFANNEIRCKVQTEPSQSKRPTDKAEQRASEHRAVLLDEYADNRRVILQHFSRPIGYEYHENAVAWQHTLFGERRAISFETIKTPIYPAQIEVAEGDEVRGYGVRLYDYSVVTRRNATLLDITKKSQHLSHAACWGKAQRPKAFGSSARHKVLESGAVIDREKPRNSTYELTLTLPGSTPEAIAAVAAWSGWIVNRQLQSIRRIDESIRPWWFFVWEFQRRGALHQHWCIAADTPELAYSTAMEIRQLWYKCLQELQEKAGVDCFARKGFGTWRDTPKAWQWHCQVIKKSVAAYFSKYCGKGSVNVVRESRYTRVSKIQYPSRWWGSSSQVKLAIKNWRQEARLSGLTREFAEFLRCKLLSLVSGLQITKQYQYDFDIKGYIPTNRDESKNRRVSYASGNVWVLYVEPNRFPDVWSQFRDILGNAEERAKGATIMQACASIEHDSEHDSLDWAPYVFGMGANSLP